MSNLSTFRAPVAKNASGSLAFTPGTGTISYVAPTKLSQFTNDIGVVAGSVPNVANTLVQRDQFTRINAGYLSLSGGGDATGVSAGIELGSLTAVQTPYIDFHSSGTSNDWDYRIIVSGGSANTVTGAISFNGGSSTFNTPVTVGNASTLANNINLTLAESTVAPSKRASIQIGQGWQIGQDSQINGTRDLFVYNYPLSQVSMLFNAATGNVGFAGAVTASAMNISANTDAVLAFEDIGAATNTFRRKQIFSSRNVNGGNDWLFRHIRPSDGASQDFILKAGAGGNIWTTGNVLPLISMRMAYAGDQSAQTAVSQTGGNIWEPYSGAVTTGITGVYQAGSSQYAWVQNMRWRYLQMQTADGTWYTVAYV